MSDNAIATVEKPDVQQLLAKVGDKRLSFGARVNSVGDVMKAMQSRMMAALPKHITADRMIRVSINCIRKDPKLLDCDPASLFGAITEAATYGWELGGVLGHAYLVPFKRECTLIPGYKGLIDLCRRSGQISTISLEVVHDGDKFSYSLGDDPHITHVPNDHDPKRDKKPITHVYAVVRFRDGGVQRSVWSAERIDSHKEQYSKAWAWAEKGDKSRGGGKKDSVWHTSWSVMARKTVIRDMIQRGLVPVSAEYRDVVDRGLEHDDDGEEFGTFELAPDAPGIEGTVEGDVVERPDTGDSPDESLRDFATAELAGIESFGDIEAVKTSLLRDAKTDTDRTMIEGLCKDRADAIRANKKKETVKS